MAEQNALTTINWRDAEVLKTIKETVAAEATDSEFKMFVLLASSTGLNPLKREIWFIKTKSYEKKSGEKVEGKVQVLTGINGFFAIANSHPEYEGYEIIESDEVISIEKDYIEVWDYNLKGHKLVEVKLVKPISVPRWIECRVYRKDRKFPTVARARWSEYAKELVTVKGKLTVWGKLGTVMLAKCAKAMAHREAFPQQLSGLYIEEEVADVEDQPQEQKNDNAVDTSVYYDLGLVDDQNAPMLDERTKASAQKYLESQGAQWVEDLLVWAAPQELEKLKGCIVTREQIDARIKRVDNKKFQQSFEEAEERALDDAVNRIGNMRKQLTLNN